MVTRAKGKLIAGSHPLSLTTDEDGMMECPANADSSLATCPKRFLKPIGYEDIKRIRTHVQYCHPLCTMDKGQLNCPCAQKRKPGPLTEFCSVPHCLVFILPPHQGHVHPNETSRFPGKDTIASTLNADKIPPWIQNIATTVIFTRQSAS
jgi:hypothetical protein